MKVRSTREAALTRVQGLTAAAELLFLAIAQAESHYPTDLLSWIAWDHFHLFALE